MEVILKENIKGLGYKNDIITVKPGYARNYLIPKTFAIIANESNRKRVKEDVKQATHKAEKIKQTALDKVTKIEAITLIIKAKAGESGRIFGAVTTLQISDALMAKGIKVDRKQISLNAPVKNLGNFKAQIDLHKEAKAEVDFEVVAD